MVAGPPVVVLYHAISVFDSYQPIFLAWMNAWMMYGAVNHDIVSSLKAHAIKDQQSFSKPMQYTFLASSHAWMMTNV